MTDATDNLESEWVNVDEKPLTLEEKEDALYVYKPASRFGKFFGQDYPTRYPYTTPQDFKDLSVDQILTRRLKMVKPDIEAGLSVLKQGILTDSQRKALLRLNAIKSTVEQFPNKEKQDQIRADLITRYSMENDKKKEIDELINKLGTELINEEVDKINDEQEMQILKKRLNQLKYNRDDMPTDQELQQRLEKLRQKGGKYSLISKSKNKTRSKRNINKRTVGTKTVSKRKYRSILKNKSKKLKNKKRINTKRKLVSFRL
jgi:hypothetical protein